MISTVARSRVLARTTKQVWREAQWQRNRCLSTAQGYYYSDLEDSDDEEKSAQQKTNNKKWIAKLDEAVLRYPSSGSASTSTAQQQQQQQQQQPFSFEIHAPGRNGAHVVLGANATGKSLLGHALAYNSALVEHGQLDDEHDDPHVIDPTTVQHHIPANAPPSQRGRPSVATVSFESHERLLQQGEMSVYQALTPDGGVLSKAAQFLVVRFGLYSFLTRHVHTLSTGEIRKVLLIRALARRPQLLVLDNAFDGLDVASRDVLKELVRQTAQGFRADILVQGVDSKATAHTQVLLLTHRAQEIGDEVARVTFLQQQNKNGAGETDGTTTTTVAVTEDREGRTGEELLAAALPEVSEGVDPWDDDEALPSVEAISDLWSQYYKVEPIEPHHDSSLVHLYNFSVNTKDGTKELISNLNWNVQQGQRWLVAGGNGAGKSTLSRYLAHPEQAVGEGSLHVTLSPDAVGWVSTERHMSMARSRARARDVLLGLDQVVDEPPKQQEQRVDEVVGETVARWLHLRGDQLSRPFAELSQGEQKMVLIGSAIAKLPKLLIIDEPLQGLDLRNRRLVLGLVERLCRATDIGLIYVTHHFEELIPAVSHVIHLKEGGSVFNNVIAAYDPSEF